MSNLTAICGAPGSGKSTLLRSMKAKNPALAVYVEEAGIQLGDVFELLQAGRDVVAVIPVEFTGNNKYWNLICSRHSLQQINLPLPEQNAK